MVKRNQHFEWDIISAVYFIMFQKLKQITVSSLIPEFYNLLCEII